MQKILVPSHGEDHSAEAVVIGGGIIGVATAFYLSRAGVDTLLIEMRDGLSSLTSAASIESFRKQFAEPAMAALARESVEVWENFPHVIGIPDYDIGLTQQGYLFISGNPDIEPDFRKTVDLYHHFGVTDSQLLGREEIRKAWPFISPDVVAGIYRQKDGWFSVHEATQGFFKGSQARFFLKTRAVAVERDAKGVCGIKTDRGFISTRVVVNAAGPFAGHIGQMVGVALPLEPVRRQKIYVANQPLVPPDAPLTMDVDDECYWRPETGGALAGWLDPAEPVSDPMENPQGDWDFPAMCIDKNARLTPFWNEIAAHLKTTDLSTSAGQYVYSPDHQPILGPVEEVPGFYLNCGYWPGIMLSPAAGHWTAKMITGEMSHEDNPLRLKRFEEGETTAGGTFLSGRS